ncbi:hypothetical protein [uncultured Bradyrhizobium sp.]|jgi:hypothetical protein|uniref:hypothetical protein n=1 Tax=uncultured Bradyrhizobium sp. TaxID=199684 RepID=UPI002614E5D6|nr:hypothetical protein [uncultured Bradyrhizobium sp.]
MVAFLRFIDLVLLPENLIWAWRKARHLYQASDALHDQAEVAAFELNLDAELGRMSREIRQGKFRTTPIRLLPQPKRPDSDGKPRMRQSFQLAVRDQVAWIAIVNVIGPSLDRLMPSWSYGHRLYRSAWYDNSDSVHHHLRIGPYRHTTSNLYRKFKHSWPLFRRHVSLTARKMATGSINVDELDQGDQQALYHAIEFSKVTDRLSYLEDNFWNFRGLERAGANLYYASFDLEKFYPSIRLASISAVLDRYLPEFSSDSDFRTFVERMLQFEVRTDGLSDSMKAAVDPPTLSGQFSGLPTGLMVAGFLANVALLPVDHDVETDVSAKRDFAQFRFVDDHSILAFSFETLVERIEAYRDLLIRHGVGAQIARDKYDPPGLSNIVGTSSVGPEARSSSYNEVRKDCEIDGRRPNKLLTRTLAQVSLLAAADFDTLSDDVKLQRLEQLEWLLLANIPEREVRADTRAAFAAGRITALAPAIFHTSPELVEALRAQMAPRKEGPGPEQSSMGFPIAVHVYSTSDEERWKKHCRHYFSLLFQAFAEHPDKVRLLIRLLEYGKATGYDVFSSLGQWMEEHATGANYLLKRYLSALTLHAISKLVVVAGSDLTRPDLLQRQIRAAQEFLDSILKFKIDLFVDQVGVLSRHPEFFQLDALRCFQAGLRSAAAVTAGVDSVRSQELDRLADRVMGLGWGSASILWRKETGYPIGVWVHWGQSFLATRSNDPSPVWAAAAGSHDPADRSDWSSLRRFPTHLTRQGWAALEQNPRLINDDDSGWLLDAARANQKAFEALRSDTKPFRQVRRALAGAPKGYATLGQWVGFTATLNGNDPRAGEWTALEIVRQMTEPLLEAFASVERLEVVHPENILVPLDWFGQHPTARQSEQIWTWQSWRAQVRRSKVRLSNGRIDDFRLHPSSSAESRGFLRVRGVAQILWGLLRQSFVFPAIWNIRGEERATITLVRSELEDLRISSITLAILEATLGVRNKETLLMPIFPTLFGGLQANDTLLDPPMIRTINDFDRALRLGQRVLEDRQVTVLNHHPRQLIPANIGQLAQSTFSVIEEEDEP